VPKAQFVYIFCGIFNDARSPALLRAANSMIAVTLYDVKDFLVKLLPWDPNTVRCTLIHSSEKIFAPSTSQM